MYKATYDKIVAALVNFNKADTKDTFMRNAKSRYMLKTNVRSDNLFRKIVKKVKVDGITQVERYERKVLWYERAFDIIHQTHLKLAHSTYARTHKTTIDDVWWGLPENAVQIYINLCPDCVRSTKPPIAEDMNPLRMIISKTIGCRAQMDLVDFQRKPDKGFRWILRYVDHHSGFAHVACLKKKTSLLVGRALIKIMSTAVIPQVLQSDNGGEFLGKCLEYVKKYFASTNIVKGRPRRPRTQGSVERGNAPFKKALHQWIIENPTESWSQIGAYVVNKSINSRPGENRAQKSPYEIYYGKESQSISYMLDSDILKHATTEYGLTAAELLLNKVAEVDKDIMVELEEIQRAIQGGDEVHEQEVKLKILAKKKQLL